ncbi:hypothetical protein BHM03_00053820 [Ensete ventricosum]|nr:hypothetical protein BHM03_00053820 [Ensete ventricosum]
MKKATKTSKAADISGLRQITQRRSRRVVYEAMKETASSAALAAALPLHPRSGSSREGDVGSGSRKGFALRFSRYSSHSSNVLSFLLPRRFFFPCRS